MGGVMKVVYTQTNEIRSSLASCIRQLLEEHEDMNTHDITYDLGYIRALCFVLNKIPLSNWVGERVNENEIG
tara:strand:+ start:336 stop:551 length:216 start_codon:yes stop_codon:yes gene_type:complete